MKQSSTFSSSQFSKIYTNKQGLTPKASPREPLLSPRLNLDQGQCTQIGSFHWGSLVDQEKDYTYNEDELLQQKFDITKDEILALNQQAMEQLEIDFKLQKGGP